MAKWTRGGLIELESSGMDGFHVTQPILELPSLVMRAYTFLLTCLILALSNQGRLTQM